MIHPDHSSIRHGYIYLSYMMNHWYSSSIFINPMMMESSFLILMVWIDGFRIRCSDLSHRSLCMIICSSTFLYGAGRGNFTKTILTGILSCLVVSWSPFPTYISSLWSGEWGKKKKKEGGNNHQCVTYLSNYCACTFMHLCIAIVLVAVVGMPWEEPQVNQENHPWWLGGEEY